MKYIDIEKEFTNFKKGQNNRDFYKKNIGKYIIYVDRVDQNRGYYRIEGGIITSVRYNTVYLNDYNNQFDIRDCKEIAVKND